MNIYKFIFCTIIVLIGWNLNASSKISKDSLLIPKSYSDVAISLIEVEILPKYYKQSIAKESNVDPLWIMLNSFSNCTIDDVNYLLPQWKNYGVIDNEYYEELKSIFESEKFASEKMIKCVLKLSYIRRLMAIENARAIMINNFSRCRIPASQSYLKKVAHFQEKGKYLDDLFFAAKGIVELPTKTILTTKDELKEYLEKVFRVVIPRHKKYIKSSIEEENGSYIFRIKDRFPIYELNIDVWVNLLELDGELKLNEAFFNRLIPDLKQYNADIGESKSVTVQSFSELFGIEFQVYKEITKNFEHLKIFKNDYYLSYFPNELYGKEGLAMTFPYENDDGSYYLNSSSFYIGDGDANVDYITSTEKKTIVNRLGNLKKNFDLTIEDYENIRQYVLSTLQPSKYDLLRIIPKLGVSVPILGPFNVPDLKKGKNKFSEIFPDLCNYFGEDLNEWTVKRDKENELALNFDTGIREFKVNYGNGHPIIDILREIKKDLDNSQRKIYTHRSLMNLDIICLYLTKQELMMIQGVLQSELIELKE